MDPLDNIMWHSLGGPHLHLAEGDARARRYPPEFGPFAAVPDEPLPEHFVALRDVVGPEGVALLFRGDVATPDGWDLLGAFEGVQMIWAARALSDDVDPSIVTLGNDDVDEMVDLAEEAKPGPFAPRTVELGTYLGVRIDGRLVAMAGQRARTSQHVEISAVCTKPAYAGKGLGRALMYAQIRSILDEDMMPMLHTSVDNQRAIALYEYLGFEHRRQVNGVIMRSPR